jgi:hypothetical protein
LMPTVPNCKMQRRLSSTCMNICHTDQRHHIVVQEGLYICYFGRWKLKSYPRIP